MSRAGLARRGVLAAVVAMAALAGPAPAASAHSDLVSTDPAAGAELTAAPAQAALTSNEDVEPQFATVVVSVAGNLGLVPTAGVPFPLLSYGGTAAAVHIATLGLVLALVLILLAALDVRAGQGRSRFDWQGGPGAILVVVCLLTLIGWPLSGLALAAGYSAGSLAAAIETLRRSA